MPNDTAAPRFRVEGDKILDAHGEVRAHRANQEWPTGGWMPPSPVSDSDQWWEVLKWLEQNPDPDRDRHAHDQADEEPEPLPSPRL